MPTTARPLAPAPGAVRPVAPTVPAQPTATTSSSARHTATGAPARGKPARPVPTRQTGYAHLDVTALRALRTTLSDEESKTSYWRRILQARIDVLEAGSPGRGTLDHQHLAPVLATERMTAGRSALIRVLLVDDVPPLPSLAQLWEQDVTGDEPARVQLVADLRVAEGQLSEYRRALHARISEVTTDLIARYRDEPSLCLAALPTAPAPHRTP